MNTSIITTVALAFLALILVGCIVMLFKSDITCKNRHIIIGAIYRHDIANIKQGRYADQIPHGCMEDYGKTMWRLTDWSYQNIVPPDAYEKIKPYIREE